MSSDEIKELDRRFWEAWNKGKATFTLEMDELCDTDVVFHGWSSKDYGFAEHKQHGNEFFLALPDLHFNVDDMIVEGEKVVVRYTLTGTNKGEFRGMPPTNKKVALWGIDIHRFSGHKIVECWSRIDTVNFMQQLSTLQMR